jgi:hypothetical protein
LVLIIILQEPLHFFTLFPLHFLFVYLHQFGIDLPGKVSKFCLSAISWSSWMNGNHFILLHSFVVCSKQQPQLTRQGIFFHILPRRSLSFYLLYQYAFNLEQF